MIARALRTATIMLSGAAFSAGRGLLLDGFNTRAHRGDVGLTAIILVRGPVFLLAMAPTASIGAPPF